MSIGNLTFRARYGADDPVSRSDGILLRGEIEWIATGPTGEIGALMDAVGESFGQRASSDTVLLRFGNAIGRFQIGSLGLLEVRCGKWGEETFDAMLEDLSRVALGLPFSASQTGGLPHDRSLADRDGVVLHAFLYARHIVLTSDLRDALAPALEAIVRDPHRRFAIARERIDLGRARRLDARTLERIAAGAEPLADAIGVTRGLRLARILGDRLPDTIEAPRIEHGVDTAENRFVRAFLDQVLAVIDRVEKIARSKPTRSLWRSLVVDCERMRRVLAKYTRHDLWSDIGPMIQVPLGSSVLQRRRGYKDVLRHHFAIRAAAMLPIDERDLAKNLLGMKDVASLYELWSFFAVVRAIGELLGRPDIAEHPRVDESQIDVPWGLHVGWAKQVDVFYNLSFSRTAPRPRHSSSLLLRPDIVVQILRDGATELHVFDAKLRLQGAKFIVESIEDDDAAPLSFKRDDVVKMHAYRDALPDVRSAFVLYPGNEEITFEALEDGATTIDGVGAIPFIPGAPSRELTLRLRHVFAHLLDTDSISAA